MMMMMMMMILVCRLWIAVAVLDWVPLWRWSWVRWWHWTWLFVCFYWKGTLEGWHGFLNSETVWVVWWLQQVHHKIVKFARCIYALMWWGVFLISRVYCSSRVQFLVWRKVSMFFHCKGCGILCFGECRDLGMLAISWLWVVFCDVYGMVCLSVWILLFI